MLFWVPRAFQVVNQKVNMLFNYGRSGAGVVTQWVKLPLVTAILYQRASSSPLVQLPIQLPANVIGRTAEDGPDTYILVTHVGDSGKSLGS